jgi:hypothetical protein
MKQENSTKTGSVAIIGSQIEPLTKHTQPGTGLLNRKNLSQTSDSSKAIFNRVLDVTSKNPLNLESIDELHKKLVETANTVRSELIDSYQQNEKQKTFLIVLISKLIGQSIGNLISADNLTRCRICGEWELRIRSSGFQFISTQNSECMHASCSKCLMEYGPSVIPPCIICPQRK